MDSKAVHSEYRTLDSRLRTFSEWPKNHCLTPNELAKNGFFHVFKNDNVICFHCGVGLYNFVRGDDVFIEHARFSPLCLFLKQMYTLEQIQKAQREKPAFYSAKYSV